MLQELNAITNSAKNTANRKKEPKTFPKATLELWNYQTSKMWTFLCSSLQMEQTIERLRTKQGEGSIKIINDIEMPTDITLCLENTF